MTTITIPGISPVITIKTITHTLTDGSDVFDVHIGNKYTGYICLNACSADDAGALVNSMRKLIEKRTVSLVEII